MDTDTSFAPLVSLGCHDIRTPLAAVHGFVRTLARTGDLQAPADRYVEIIDEASGQITDLLDQLSLAARIESGRYAPALRPVDTLELAQGAAARLGEDRVRVSGEGATIETDVEALSRGVSALARSALRYGGLDEVQVVVRGTELELSPITPTAAPVVVGEDLKDFGAAVAVRLVERLGGSADVVDGTLVVSLG
jgi:signal transduction histidine kinase